jgi:fatty-acyl-CoA synthase
VNASDVLAVCAEQIARYKLPKAVLFVDAIRRTPAGKADYRWAVDRATHENNAG